MISSNWPISILCWLRPLYSGSFSTILIVALLPVLKDSGNYPICSSMNSLNTSSFFADASWLLRVKLRLALFLGDKYSESFNFCPNFKFSLFNCSLTFLQPSFALVNFSIFYWARRFSDLCLQRSVYSVLVQEALFFSGKISNYSLFFSMISLNLSFIH